MFRRVAALLTLIVLAAAPHLMAAQSHRPVAAKPSGIVNINSAGATELESLPGVGAKTAARIIEYRQKNGPFKKVEELMNVRGIGEKNFLKLKGQLTVSGKTGETAAAQQ
jgi:competence protein ComEA